MSDEKEPMVRIAWYGDSGLYGQWSKLDDDETHGSGPFGKTEPHLIPEHLWLAFDEADNARQVAEKAIEDFLAAPKGPQ